MSRESPVLETLEEGGAGDAQLPIDALAVIVEATERTLDNLSFPLPEHLL